MTIQQNGHSIYHSAADVTFQIPGWGYSKIVSEEIPSHFATAGMSLQDQERLTKANLSRFIIAHIDRFKDAADAYAFEKARQFSRVYNHFDDKGESTVTIDQVAQFVFYGPEAVESPDQTPTPAELYATYQFLLKTSAFFEPSKGPSMRKGRSFTLRLRNEVDDIRWIWKQLRAENAAIHRKESSPLNEFIEKCQTLVHWHRDSARFGSGKEDTPAPEVNFTDSDRVFISSLRKAATHYDILGNPHVQIASNLIRRLHPLYTLRYGKNASGAERQAAQLLKEIGALTPWENTSMYRPGERSRIRTLEGHGMSAWADDVAAEAQELGKDLIKSPEFIFNEQGKVVKPETTAEESVKETPHVPKQSLLELVKSMIIHPAGQDELNFYATDPCAEIRRDFGDLPVFVIDDPTAHELDDGMSVEKTADGDLWVHVHIADPTAYIPPTHPLSLTAQLRGNSVYLPERHYPMMPDFTSNERFNLGKSQCAMTFSARIGEDGEFLDFDVKPSIVRNVKILYYDDVDEVLDWTDIYGVREPAMKPSPWTRQLLEAKDAKPGFRGDTAPGLDTEGVELLRSLQNVMKRAARERTLNGGFYNDQCDLTVKVKPYPQPFTPVTPEKPFFPSRESFPTITLKPDAPGILSPAHMMVAECMIMAGRVAAKWCTEHNVPGIYRGQMSIIEHGHKLGRKEEATLLMKNAYAAIDKPSGVMPFMAYMNLVPLMPPAAVSATPIPHLSMGIGNNTGYMKVTSPLRRYKDMVAHWNMKASMLGQPYPFGPEAVAEIATRLRELERRTSALNNRSNQHWSYEWLRRKEVLVRNGQAPADVVGNWDMPYVDMRETVNYQEDSTLREKGPVYKAFVTSLSPDKKALWTVLTELGGMRARVEVGWEEKETDALVGQVIDVRLHKVDSWKGVILMKKV
ncbi:uncharacterized protein EV422DRAFT_501666 [Fimicolochytrium jonesii]|uniref:uncharacterized protein n=1 Tax=Fimicolochytrium jonesii TaxID=1396493 RepID=UPI0022FF1FE9|nr:uncharacterized protein EV422DRAFT_501666 [Fimicolochytrium jonesii]KAI8816078.1 hypothetical protein EV422DRAFT_501666 [Fimicolochytrium jonesii]